MDCIKFGNSSSNKKYLVIYDISSNSTRNRTSKLLDGYGRRIQKSAYEVSSSPKSLRALLLQVEKMLIAGDSIRAYEIDFNNVVSVGRNVELDYDSDLFII